MARAWVEDMWFTRTADGVRTRTDRHGRGLQWRVRWYDDRRRMRARSFRTKRDAEAWQATIEHEIRDGTYRDRTLGQVSFGEVAEEWLRQNAGDPTWPAVYLALRQTDRDFPADLAALAGRWAGQNPDDPRARRILQPDDLGWGEDRVE